MWKDLTIEQKAEIFRNAVSAGLTSLDEIKKLYNKQSKINIPDIDDPYPEGMGENHYSNGGHTDTVEDYYYPITPVPSDYTTSVENTILYPINNFLTYNGNLFKKGGKANNRVPSWQTQKAQDLWWSKGQRIYNMMINEWGLTPAEAIGIIANMAIESGFDPNIKSPVDKHGVSYTGLVQNEPSIVNYIKKYYGDYSEASQLQFLRDGLEGKMRGADKNRQGKGLQKRLQEYKAYVSKLDPNDELIYRRAAGAFNAHYENPQIGASKGVYEVGEPRMYTGEQMGIRLGRTTQTTTPTVQPTIQQTPISDRKIVASPPATTNKEEKKAYSPKYKAEREGEWEYSGPNIPYIDKRLPPDVALLLAGVPFKHTNEWGKIRSSNAGYGVAKSHHSRRFDSNTNISKAWDEYRTQLKTMVPEEDWPEVEKKLNELDKFVRTGTHPAAIDLNGWFGGNKNYDAYKDAFKGLANPALVRYSTEAGYGALREWTKEEQRAYRATGPNIHFGPSRSSKYLLATNPHVTPYNTYWEDRAALMNTSLPVQETPSVENVDYSDIYAENTDTPTVYENEVERRTGTQNKGGFDSEEGSYFNPIALDEVVVTPPKILPSEEDDARMLLDDYYFGNNIEMPLRNRSVIPDLIMPNYVSHIPQTPMLEVNMSTPYTDLILGRGRNIAKNGGRINIFDDGGLTNLYTLGEDEYGIYPLSEVEATPNIGNLEARSKLREIFGGDMVAATKYMEGIPVDENSDNHEITHINNLYYLWKKAGSPKYTNSGSLASLGDPIGALMNWDKRYFYRPSYHPNTFLTDNVIYVPHESEKWKNKSFYDEYLAELSHAIQYEGIGRGETFDKLDENNPLNKESAYSTPYTTEYNAHTIIEPKLRALLEFYNEDSDEVRDLGWNIFKEKVLNAANPGREVQESLANEYINRIKAEFKTANEHIDPRSALPTIMYPNVNLNGTLNNEVYKYKNGGRLFGIGGYSNPNTNEFWASKGWRWEDVTNGKAKPGVEYTNLPTSGKVLIDSEGYYVPKRIADEYQKMNYKVQETPTKLTNTLPTDAIAAPPRITPSIPKMPKNELVTKGKGYLRNYYFHNGKITDENGNEISPFSEGNAGADFHQLLAPDVPFEGPVLDTITVSAQANPNKPLDKAYTVFPWEDLTPLEKAEAQRDGINVHYTTSPEVEKDAYDFQYSTSPSAHEMELKKADDFVRNFSMTQPNAKEMNNLLNLAEIIAMGAGGAYGMWAAPIATLGAAGAGTFGSNSLNSLINYETKGAYKTWGDWASDKLTRGLITPENMEITNPLGLIEGGIGFKTAPPIVRSGAEFVNYAIPNRATRVLWDLSNDYGATPLWDIIKDNNKLNNITYILDKNDIGMATSAAKNRNLKQINEIRQFVADANIASKTSMLPKGLDTFYNNTPSKFMGRREQFIGNINGGVAHYSPKESKVYLPLWRNSASNVPLDYSYNWQPYQRVFVSPSIYASNGIYEHMSGRWLAGHELEHAAQELANYDITSLPDPSINKSYFYANPNHPLYNKGLNILDESKTPWQGSPSEVDSEIMGFRTLYNQPEYTHMSPIMQKKLRHFISKRFDITKEEANTLIKLLTENRLTAPGQ